MSNNEQAIVERIRNEYTERTPSKVTELVAMNRKVKQPAEITAYTLGTVGSLVLGTGMSLAMKVIGASLSFAMPLGIGIGCLGIAMVALNYPLYKKILAKRKQKYAKQILALSGELLHE